MPTTMTTDNRPNPYRVDSPLVKVQTLDEDGEHKFLFRHDFARLDATNVDLLYQREKSTKRITEKMTKGRTRARFRSEEADKAFYRALVQGGGWRPFGLSAKEEEGLIEPSFKQFYKFDDETKLWEPSWMELDQQTMFKLTAEKMGEAIEAWFLCRGRNIGTGTIEFMFEQAGLMRIGLHIGDDDTPAYKLLFEMRRPDDKRRTRFKEDFAFAVDNSKGGLGNVETVIDNRAAVAFFDEYFATCPNDKKYSEILLTDKSVEPVDGQPETLIPYNDSLRDYFVTTFNPNFKVEVAASVVSAFSKTDQELQTR